MIPAETDGTYPEKMLNWREIPFVRLLAAFIAGILLSIHFNHEIPGAVTIVIALFLLTLAAKQVRGLYRRRWLFGMGLNLLLALSGYLVTWHHHELNHASHFSNMVQSPSDVVVGIISEAPVRKEDWVKIELRARGAGPSAEHLKSCTGNLLLYLQRDSATDQVEYGDLLAFQGNITLVTPPMNPHAFDYARFLHFQNIHYQSFVREGKWQVLSGGHGNPVYAAAIRWQRHFLKTLQKHLDDPLVLAVGSALILGYRDEMPEEILTSYAETGAMHVLAVSGLHVGIVAMLLNFFLGRIRWHSRTWKVARVLILLAFIWAFAFVTGASPSVLRATVMFSFLTVGLSMQRFINFYNTLAVSAFCLLLYDPYWLMSVSFQLSYLAVLGIVYFVPKIERLWRIENKVGRYLWQLICVSIGAMLMTMPVSLFYFHQFPTYFWLSSLILVQLAGFDLFFGLLLLLTEAVWPMAAVWVGKALYGLLWLGNASVFLIQKLPGALAEGIWIGSWTVLLLYLALTSGMAAVSFKKFKWAITGLGFLLVASIGFAFRTMPQLESRKLVVYHVYKHTALDFFDGKTAYSLIDNELDRKSLGFAAEGNRLANGIRRVQAFNLEDTTGYSSGTWFFKKGFVQFYDTRLAIVQRSVKFAGDQKVGVDYLLLRGSPKVEVEDLLKIFDFKMILFDASNKKWQVEKWKNQCEQLGIEYFDVNEAGAFVLDLQTGKPD